MKTKTAIKYARALRKFMDGMCTTNETNKKCGDRSAKRLKCETCEFNVYQISRLIGELERGVNREKD